MGKRRRGVSSSRRRIRTNDGVGDGTTTATVLAHAMIDEGEKVIREKGFNVIQLAEELKKASAVVVKALEGPARAHQ